MSLSILQRLQAQRTAAAAAKARREEKKSKEASASASKRQGPNKSSSSAEPTDADVKSNAVTTWHTVPILLLYGTQTGNAKEIAGIIVEEAKASGHRCIQCMSMRDYVTSKSLDALPTESVVIAVVSTTGQGDPPNNAEDFWRLIRRKKDPRWLQKTNFAVLGLGDTNYADFCAMGKFFDSKFASLGANRFFKTGLADDATGIDEVVEPWRVGLLSALKELCENLSRNGLISTSQTKSTKAAQDAGSPEWFPMPQGESILILTGEEDGTVTPESKKLFNSLKDAGFQDIQIEGMKEFVKKDRDLTKLAHVGAAVIMMSTSGPGEAPANAMRFLRSLKKSKQSRAWLAKTRIVVLGLGNTNYENFGGCAKEASKYFENLGARHHPLFLTCIDKEGNLDEECTKWRKSLLSAFQAKGSQKSPKGRKPKVMKAPVCSIKLEIDHECRNPHRKRNEGLIARLQSHLVDREKRGLAPDAPFVATVKSGKLLTSEVKGSQKNVMHLELSLPGASASEDNVIYLPGDSIGIHCPNTLKEVDRLLARLKLRGEEIITSISQPTSDSSSKTSRRRGRASGSLAHIFLPVSVRDVFLYCIDITSPPRKTFLKVLASHCSEPNEKEKILSWCALNPEGRKSYAEEILKGRPSLADLLERFPSCSLPLEHLLEFASPLLPRYYSIASSPISHPTDVHIAFSLVEYTVTKADGERIDRRGLCTDYLYRECSCRNIVSNDYLRKFRERNLPKATDEPLSLPVFIRRGGEFGYPSDIVPPMVMVGPGTGVAPFRGFLHYRQHQIRALESGASGVGAWRGLEWCDEDSDDSDDDRRVAYPGLSKRKTSPVTSITENFDEPHESIGEAVLFFGCQKRNLDYLYGAELENFEDNGTLNAFHVAFSREQEKKVYVQDLMLKNAEYVYRLVVEKGGYLFVCGDGTRMAKDVMNAMIQIIVKQGKMSQGEAKAQVLKMMKEKKYVQDIWS
mmetsp:Transcript_23600/g.57162  ORF Transcript_23600/g.57162 Transcript_23600/m.57162 type:complete len:969 (+) Transcript_23600:326-3232(+)